MAKRTARKSKGNAPGSRVYELEVSLIGAPVTERFAKENPQVSRTIRIRADQTLERLHEAIFDAFDREEEHMYEFQVGGKAPMDPKADRYVLPMAADYPLDDDTSAGLVGRTRIADLGLKARQAFLYWFDFGDDWWHRIDVAAVLDDAPAGDYPCVTKTVGESPPQYIDWDEEDEEGEEDEEEGQEPED